MSKIAFARNHVERDWNSLKPYYVIATLTNI